MTGRKQVDDILLMMKDPTFRLGDILKKVRTAEDCQKFVDNKLNKQFLEHGFTKVDELDESTKLQYTYYHKDPLTVLRNQVKVASSSNCYFCSAVPANEIVTPVHPMLASLGTVAVPAVQQEIEKSSDADVIWRSSRFHAVQSFVCVAQLYSDKSAATLKARGFSFYPLHIILLNFDVPLPKQLISSGKSIVGYLPVHFYDENNGSLTIRKQDIQFRKLKLKAIHGTIRSLLSPLFNATKRGISCIDANGISRLGHVAIGSYCCDIPEAKDMSGILSGQKTMRTCFRCHALTSEMHSTVEHENRSLSYTLKTIERSKKLRDRACYLKENKNTQLSKTLVREAESQLKSQSLSGMLPVLHEFPFMGNVPELDWYRIVSFEPMHNLHLGVSRLVKQVTVSRMKDEALKTSFLKTANGRDRAFSSVRSFVLSGANEILRNIGLESSMKNVRIDYSNPQKGWRYNGFFTEDGIIGMLEAKDYKSFDIVFPFVAAYIDLVCGESQTCPTTGMSVLYSEIVTMIYCRGSQIRWTEETLMKLSSKIRAFKSICKEIYSRYHSSKMGTLKFHLFDYLVDDLRRFGTIQVLDANLFEYSHTLFKKKYKSTSKKHSTAMQESIRELQREGLYSSVAEKATNGYRSTYQGWDITDSAVLSRDGRYFSLDDLIRGKKAARSARVNGTNLSIKEFNDVFEKTAQQILEDVSEVGTRVLIRQLKEWWFREFGTAAPTCDRAFKRVTSAYVRGGYVPTLEEFDDVSGTIRLKKPERSIENRLVSALNFCGNKKLRQDYALVESKEMAENETVWIAKSLLFIRVRVPAEMQSQMRNGFETETSEASLVFLKYFETVSPRSRVDNILGCVKLQWQGL